MSVIEISVKSSFFQVTGTFRRFVRSFLVLLEFLFGQSVACRIDKLFTIGIRPVILIVPKTRMPVPKTVSMSIQPPILYTRMCFPSDLARTGDLTQGLVGPPVATVGDRMSAGNAAKDGLPLPGDGPPDGDNEAPAWGRNLHPLTTGKGVSLPTGRVF